MLSFNFPEPVTLKRFLALDLVFILGIFSCFNLFLLTYSSNLKDESLKVMTFDTELSTFDSTYFFLLWSTNIIILFLQELASLPLYQILQIRC
jgi:hypothetical protein